MPINPYLAWFIIGTFGLLAIGSIIRFLTDLNATNDPGATHRWNSLKVWWTLALLWSTAAVFERIGVTCLLALASLMGLRELLRLVDSDHRIGWPALGSLWMLGLVHYLLIAFGHFGLAISFLPLAALLVLGAVRETTCSTENYIRTTAGLYWSSMLLLYALSHAAFLIPAQPRQTPLVGPSGMFLFLIVLTEANDIAQALVGRRLGKHKVIPGVSPNKSVEGLVGGIVSTCLIAVLLAPWLTHFLASADDVPPKLSNWLGYDIQSLVIVVVSGLVIAISGFLGDINMSAIKRDAGVKDGSDRLPGMGGVIDRIDSLVFTAPVFYYFTHLVNAFNR